MNHLGVSTSVSKFATEHQSQALQWKYQKADSHNYDKSKELNL